MPVSSSWKQKVTVSGCILREQLTRFTNKWSVGVGKRAVSMKTPFVLTDWRDEVAIMRDGEG